MRIIKNNEILRCRYCISTVSEKLEQWDTNADNTKFSTTPVNGSYEQETDESSKLELLDNFDYGMALKLGVLNQNIVYWFGKLRNFGFKLLVQISLHHIQLLSCSSASTFSCHQRCCERVFNDAAKRMIKWALQDQWRCAHLHSAPLHKTIPENWQILRDKLQHCSVHMDKKQRITQIWKYLITSTMSWHWKVNCNFENPSVCSFQQQQIRICPFSAEKNSTVNPQIQACPAEDVDVQGYSRPSIFKPVAPRMLMPVASRMLIAPRMLITMN